MTRDFSTEETPTRGDAPTTGTAFPYWSSTPTLDLIASADEYEEVVNGGGFAHDPDAGAELLVVAANMRTEIARRTMEHWHDSIRHSHPSGQEPHDHRRLAMAEPHTPEEITNRVRVTWAAVENAVQEFSDALVELSVLTGCPLASPPLALRNQR